MTALDTKGNAAGYSIRALARTPVMDATIAFFIAALADIFIDVTAVVATGVVSVIAGATLCGGLLWGMLVWSLYGTRRGGIASRPLREVTDTLVMRQFKGIGVIEFLLLTMLAGVLMVNAWMGAATVFLVAMTTVIFIAGMMRFWFAQKGLITEK